MDPFPLPVCPRVAENVGYKIALSIGLAYACHTLDL
jgi:hypothetical protein